MGLPSIRRSLRAAVVVCAAAAYFGAASPAFGQGLQLYSMIKSQDQRVFHGLTQMQTCDIWDPHDLTYRYSRSHVRNRLDLTVDPDDPNRVILCDIERLIYNDGHRVDYETPEDYLHAVTEIKLMRPDNLTAVDGGLSVSWARLLGRDGNTGEYRNHDDWREDAQDWREPIEAADYWAMSMYRDGHTQDEWIERTEVFADLFREQFPGKPLMIVIWHRERVGQEREEVWITMRDYVEMGMVAKRVGCHVTAFGRENDPDEFRRSQQYFAQLRNAWN